MLLLQKIILLGEILTSEFEANLNLKGLVGIKKSHAEVLIYLYRKKKATPQEISTIIFRDKATVSSIIEKLINLSLCIKINSKTDKRSYQIELSTKGKKIAKQIFKLYLNTNKNFEKEFNSNLTIELNNVLEKLLNSENSNEK